MRRRVAAAIFNNRRGLLDNDNTQSDYIESKSEGSTQSTALENSFNQGESVEDKHDEDSKIQGELDSFDNEPDVIQFTSDNESNKKSVKSSGDDNKKSLMEKFKALPMPMKIGLVIIAIAIFIVLKELAGSKKTDAASETETTSEVNLSQPAEVEPKPVPEQSAEQVKQEKLNSCLVASPLSFKFGQEGVVPMFGDQVVSGEALFCDEFVLKNYHLDGANNSLSIIGEIHSGQTLIKKISVDPLAYFKPTYYLEGISIRHPKTQAEVVYMAGDYILKSPSTTLQLTGVVDKGASVEYSLLLNGQKTAILVERKYVQ